jgi:hypothetical protein
MPFLMMFQKASSFDPPMTAIVAALAVVAISAMTAVALSRVFTSFMSVSSHFCLAAVLKPWFQVQAPNFGLPFWLRAALDAKRSPISTSRNWRGWL